MQPWHAGHRVLLLPLVVRVAAAAQPSHPQVCPVRPPFRLVVLPVLLQVLQVVVQRVLQVRVQPVVQLLQVPQVPQTRQAIALYDLHN